MRQAYRWPMSMKSEEREKERDLLFDVNIEERSQCGFNQVQYLRLILRESLATQERFLIK